MKFNLQVKGIDEVKRSLNKFNKEAVRGLQKEIDTTAVRIHKDARQAAPSDRGILRARIMFTKGRLAALVWSGAKYSLTVEHGQRAGIWPNKEDLTGWVKRKINPPRKKLKGVTYLVGKKIYEKGTKPQPYFEPAVDKWKPRYFINVTRIIKKLKL